MTREEILAAAALVVVYWPTWAMPDPDVLVDAWSPILADMTLGLVKAAVVALVTDGERFAPPIGLIRRRGLDLRAQAEGTATPDVDQAWAEVQTQIHARGFMAGQPDWSHPAIAAVVEAITWRRLCYDETQGTLLAQFRDLYRPATARAEAQRALPETARALVGADLARTLAGRMQELEP